MISRPAVEGDPSASAGARVASRAPETLADAKQHERAVQFFKRRRELASDSGRPRMPPAWAMTCLIGHAGRSFSGKENRSFPARTSNGGGRPRRRPARPKQGDEPDLVCRRIGWLEGSPGPRDRLARHGAGSCRPRDHLALMGILAAGVGSTFGILISRRPFWNVASIDSRSMRAFSGRVRLR